MYTLETKGSFVPSPDTLRKLGETKTRPVDTVSSIEERIRVLKEEHVKDLENLFRFQLAEYRQELDDHRRCYDDSAYMVIDKTVPDQVEFMKALEDLDDQMAKMERFKRDADDGLSTLRYTHAKMLRYLLITRDRLKAQQRQKRDAWFPQTIAQYQQIKDRDVQLRVARLLTGSTTEQERMMDEFGWPSRAVQPLLNAYKNNHGFKGEVNSALSGLTVSDPRRRGSRDAAVFTRFSPIS